MNVILIKDYCDEDDLYLINQIENNIGGNKYSMSFDEKRELKDRINNLLDKIVEKRNKMIDDAFNNHVDELLKRFNLKSKEELFDLIPPFEKITFPIISLNNKCESLIYKLFKLFETLL